MEINLGLILVSGIELLPFGSCPEPNLILRLGEVIYLQIQLGNITPFDGVDRGLYYQGERVVFT